MVYFAASGTFNIKDYEKAIVYFQEYLRTGEQKNRKDVFTYMAKACTNIKNYALAKTVTRRSSEQLSFGFQSFIHGNQLLHRPQRQ